MRIRERTLNLRHSLVKHLAPRLYEEHLFIKRMLQSTNVTPRPMTLFLKEYFKGKTDLVGLEIGVAKGKNALSLLQELPIRKLFLVDPYISYKSDCVEVYVFKATYKEAYKRLKDEWRRTQWIRKPSDEAYSLVTENLDFVYIDGNHSYENVKRDIANYFPLLKPDGVIGGHDYVPFYWTGLVKAVDEFAQSHGTVCDYVYPPDWLVVK